MQSMIGYINDVYSAGHKCHIGETVRARVLYVEPVTKVVHFILGNLQDRPAGELSRGDLAVAKVRSYALYDTTW